MKVCDIKGCGKSYHASGLCRPHYMAKWWKNGNPRRTNPWTKEAKSLVADMLLERLSARKIVARLAPDIRVSRNAVIGVVHRDATLRKIGLHGGSGAPLKQKARLPRVLAQPPKPIVKPVVIAPKPVLRESRSVTLMDLKRGDCKWAVNNAPPKGIHLFCGNPAQPDKPYCACHTALAVRSVRHLDQLQGSRDR